MGWALKLVRSADLPERTEGLEAVLAALMAARASFFGRAPVPEDLVVAKILAGYGEGLPDGILGAKSTLGRGDRPRTLAGAYGRF